jgi:hypothetical protein
VTPRSGLSDLAQYRLWVPVQFRNTRGGGLPMDRMLRQMQEIGCYAGDDDLNEFSDWLYSILPGSRQKSVACKRKAARACKDGRLNRAARRELRRAILALGNIKRPTDEDGTIGWWLFSRRMQAAGGMDINAVMALTVEHHACTARDQFIRVLVEVSGKD